MQFPLPLKPPFEHVVFSGKSHVVLLQSSRINNIYMCFANIISLILFNGCDYTLSTTVLNFLNVSVLSLKCTYCNLTELEGSQMIQCDLE